jgi:hypothetical protein
MHDIFRFGRLRLEINRGVDTPVAGKRPLKAATKRRSFTLDYFRSREHTRIGLAERASFLGVPHEPELGQPTRDALGRPGQLG